MSFNIGKKMTAYPPHATQDISGGGVITGGLVKVGSTLTALSGLWRGSGSLNPRFQWYQGTASIANATNASFSAQTAGTALTARMSFGNATWGTFWKDLVTGTVQP
jgi:hypothetical protein